MALRFFMISVFFLLVLSAYSAELKDPRLIFISQQDLLKDIDRTPVDAPQQLQIISRARSSHLADVAYSQYQQIQKKNPDNAWANLLAGIAAENDWEYQTAPSAGKLTPTAPEARDLIKAANSFLYRAVQLKPGFAKANMEYGYFLWRYGNVMSKGFVLLQKSVRIDPKDPTAHALLGNVYANPYSKVYDPVRAETELQKAINLDPLYSYPHLQFVFLDLTLKRYKAAQYQLMCYLDLSPEYFKQDTIIKTLQSSIDKGLGDS